jgi:hypothetical protein
MSYVALVRFCPLNGLLKMRVANRTTEAAAQLLEEQGTVHLYRAECQ